MLTVLEGLIWLIRFMFGACIFSFLNVVADRLPKKQSVVSGRSHCDSCGRNLGVADLVPCFSYIFLRGKCRTCGNRIPIRCLLTELLGGASFVLSGICFGCGSLEILSLRAASVFIFTGILTVIALIDLDTQMIYDRFNLMILVLAIANIWLFPEHGIIDRLIGLVIVSVPMLVLSLIIPGAFGGGDIKLMAVSGFFLGMAATVCGMFFGLVSGGCFALVMLKTNKLQKKDHFAFGPFLAVGLAVAAFWGDQIVAWYLRFF